MNREKVYLFNAFLHKNANQYLPFFLFHYTKRPFDVTVRSSFTEDKSMAFPFILPEEPDISHQIKIFINHTQVNITFIKCEHKRQFKSGNRLTLQLVRKLQDITKKQNSFTFFPRVVLHQSSNAICFVHQ
jgi:hypothetical protein